jgi:subtilisin family serine protease
MKLILAAVLAFGIPVMTQTQGEILGTGGAQAVPDSYIVVLKGKDRPAGRFTLKREFTKALNGFEASMPEAEARRLAADPAVAYVQRNGVVRVEPLATQPDPPSWGLDRIDQRALPLDASYTYPNTAPNVHAYIMSTGIRLSHTDFGGRAVHGWDTVDNDGDATDCNGNGTALAGVVGGAAHGVAKGVTLVAMRMLDCTGAATFAQVIAGVDWVTVHAVKPAVAVLVAGGPANTAYNDAIRNSIASGVTYTVIAGSSGSDACTFSPGGVAEAITVGGTDINDNRHSASNFGPCLDLFAPGVGITTTWWTGDTATITLTGTSFATAHAGGVAAMLLSANPAWAPQQVRDRMVADATPGVVVNPGAGSPNLLLFVNSSATPPACVGTNENDVKIPDSPAPAVTSAIVISGCGGSASPTSSVEVHIVHPRPSDLVADLLAPDGSAYRVGVQGGVVDLSSEPQDGMWRLRIRDVRAGRTGYLDSWTLNLG